MREDLHPQIAHHALTEQRGQHRFSIRAEELRDESHREQDGDACDRGRVVMRKRYVDDPLGENRARELKSAFDHQKNERSANESFVRREINEQPPHEARVICSRKRVFFVQGCGARHRAVW